MKLYKILLSGLLTVLFITVSTTRAAPTNSKLFREYIGSEDKEVTFSDIPITSKVEFHFILSFAIDYNTSSSHPFPINGESSHPFPTNGDFKVYWDTKNLTPARVSSVKAQRPNVKVAMSLGGDTFQDRFVYFSPESINSWVRNAIHSLTEISRQYNLDGIDIDYEHFHADPDTFTECIGRLVLSLKKEKIVSFVSIAPFDDEKVQAHYMALWNKYGHVIDYVNFQFYAYDKGTNVAQFLKFFEAQSSNYKGGKILVSFSTDGSGGLSPQNGFFEACEKLQQQGKLHGIFIWSADDSKKDGFIHEKKSQNFLAYNN